MAESYLGNSNTVIVIEISPRDLKDKNEKSSIIQAIFALLNSHEGGILKLTSTETTPNPRLEKLLQATEQKLIHHLSAVTDFMKHCKVKKTRNDTGQEIIFTIKPSERIFTLKYNLVLPTTSLVMHLLPSEPLLTIAHLLMKTDPLMISNLQKIVKHPFQKDARISEGLMESDCVQFKNVKSEPNNKRTLADRIIANKLDHYVCAFANHKGGHVYVGIDDETCRVCGQNVDYQEKKRVVEKIDSAIKNMVWPEEHGKPELGKHWDISFVPVVEGESLEEIPGLFVIVISIAACPGGVFLDYPETYVIKDNKVVKMEFEWWKERILHDAHMHDVPKTICRINARQNTKWRSICMRITDVMDKFIQDGNFGKVQPFAAKCLKVEAFDTPDIKVAVRFMLALAAYRRTSFKEAYQELDKASALVPFTKNSMEFEIQRLHLLACFSRGEGHYDKSYETTCRGLQELESISPGWHSAWMLCEAGYLFSILTEKEINMEDRQTRKQQAVKLYIQAIEHTKQFSEDSKTYNAVTTMSNLLHRCHLRLAMLYLGCVPFEEKNDAFCDVTDEDLTSAVANILAVEESDLKGDSLTEVNECYLSLAKSDINYRRSQTSVQKSENYLKKAVKWAKKAREVAENNRFPGILVYAQTRLDRLPKVQCPSSAEDLVLEDLDKCHTE